MPYKNVQKDIGIVEVYKHPIGITVKVINHGRKIKASGLTKKAVTANLNKHPRKGRYFRYNKKIWYLDQEPWRKVK